MKKIVLSLVALLAFQLSGSAQTVIKNDYDSPITSVNGSKVSDEPVTDGFVQGTDIGITFDTDNDKYGIDLLYDVSDVVYSGFGFGLSTGDYSSYQCNFYLGLGKRYLVSNSILLQGKIGGYLGYLAYQSPSYNDKGNVTKEDKYEFAYGLQANIAAGLKLWTTKKGTKGFVTFGYYMTAPKFKTENMFDSGSWGLGITLIK